MPSHRVAASSLNLRSEPKVKSGNIVATLSQGLPVRKVADAHPLPWWQVEVEIGSRTVSGYVNSAFLVSSQAPIAGMVTGFKAAHMPPKGSRNSTIGLANPLAEAGMPTRRTRSKAEMLAIIRWMDVEVSLRWQPKPSSTYCNVYACDVAFAAGVYIPRVWWQPEALSTLRNGGSVPVQYGTTVREMNANALTDWFEDYGTAFGWRYSTSLDELQDAANSGQLAIIVAQNKNGNKSGHIVVIAPEHAGSLAKRVNGRVTIPLQSQAGRVNHVFFVSDTKWWARTEFRKFGFWIHD